MNKESIQINTDEEYIKITLSNYSNGTSLKESMSNAASVLNDIKKSNISKWISSNFNRR